MPYYSPERPSCCPTTSIPFTYSSSYPANTSKVVTAQLKMFQAFIFSVPILFIFILLFLFYLFYLRRRRVDWASLRMRTSIQDSNDIFRAELGLKKELREMLPIIVYKESFSVRDTQCPVCLGDYQAEDRLQRIPSCGHTYHMDCIDNWLANHTTCPLCRLSLLPSSKVHSESPDNPVGSETVSGGEASVEPGSQALQVSHGTQFLQSSNEEFGAIQNNVEEEERRSADDGGVREFENRRIDSEEHDQRLVK
ncbi:hypothetical protein K2173_009056 [Erythroxylum novogranatense]|uniref:RING-type E3 ubiquitin transferase n=1 Tax=Erythroxylum novogranatense TaxID=1862640 RepID=A0AAV8TV63_9ROSI|nr:hypothetical protein K2173_009056 [Erythroxylum novogranatense]